MRSVLYFGLLVMSEFCLSHAAVVAHSSRPGWVERRQNETRITNSTKNKLILIERIRHTKLDYCVWINFSAARNNNKYINNEIEFWRGRRASGRMWICGNVDFSMPFISRANILFCMRSIDRLCVAHYSFRATIVRRWQPSSLPRIIIFSKCQFQTKFNENRSSE